MTTRIRPAGQAAIYARVSTEAQAVQDKTSLDHQEKNCRRAAERLGFTVCEDYVVREAHSASDPDNRPGLSKLYEGAARGRFQYVLMDVVDRTTRAGEWDLGDICKRFLRYDVEPLWASDPEWDLRTPEGQHEANDAAWEAYRDKKCIARRFNSGKQERIESGQLIRNHMDFGYRWNAERPAYLTSDVRDPRTSWEPDEDGDPSPAAVVRRIFTTLAGSWRHGGNVSSKQIAFQLERDHIAPPSVVKGRPRKASRWGDRPARWQHAVIIYIVQNPTYKGSRPQNRWQKRPYTAEEKKAYEARTGRKYKSSFKAVERPKDEWVYAKVPALVDEQTWADANKQLERNRKHNHRAPTSYTTADALLWGGRVFCSQCGRAIQVWRPAHRGSWYYFCRQGGPGGLHPGRPTRIFAREVDAFVWSEAQRIIRDPDYLRSRLVQGKAEVWSPEQEIAHYQALIDECDVVEEALHQELAETRGRPGLEGLRTRIYADVERNSAKRAEYLRKQDAARAELVRREGESARLAAFQEKAREAADTLDDPTPDERRQLLLDLHTTVHIARLDSPSEPRVMVVFCLTSEVAARVEYGVLWHTSNTHTPRGAFVTFVEQGWPPTPLDGDRDTVIDLDSDDDDADSEHPAKTS